VAHPTEQYGQTLGVTLAFLIRSSWAWATTGPRFTPEPARPASAMPPPAPTDNRRRSRLEISMGTLQFVGSLPKVLRSVDHRPAGCQGVLEPLLADGRRHRGSMALAPPGANWSGRTGKDK